MGGSIPAGWRAGVGEWVESARFGNAITGLSVLVGISLVPASGPLSIMRTLRILRVLRLLSTVQRLRMLIESLMRALPGIG